MQLFHIPGRVQQEFLGHDVFVLIYVPLIPWIELDFAFEGIAFNATISAKIVQSNGLEVGQRGSVDLELKNPVSNFGVEDVPQLDAVPVERRGIATGGVHDLQDMVGFQECG